MTNQLPGTILNQPLVIEDDAIRTWAGSSALEWLVTNGIGGYSSGTLAGANTRRYHAFLMAALAPPLGRTMLIARLDESITTAGQTIYLSSSQWWDESVSPRGFENLERFELQDGIPVFTYRVGDYRLEKRIWMEAGENVTWATYHWPEDAPEARLTVKLLAGWRDFHWCQHGSPDSHWKSGTTNEGFWITASDPTLKTVVKGSRPFRFHPENTWYWGFLYLRERERGLDHVEDLWVPGSLEIALRGGATACVIASAGETRHTAEECDSALGREMARRRGLISAARLDPVSPIASPPSTISDEAESGRDAAAETALAVAADAFLVRRPIDGSALPAKANTIVAGYHWFGDWGRDTMISLPGLALSTGRHDEARAILLAYSAFVSEGMLPNRFPDSGGDPEYNTVDATLWYFIAIHRYLEASGDRGLLHSLYPCLTEIVNWHHRGTRHGIRVDPNDGLLQAGVSGLQLTWMDARVGDWVITPRIGKPVEIAALWYNALRLMAGWAEECGAVGGDYRESARQAADSFEHRFWITDSRYLYDVVDGPEGDDRSFRPNQLFAVSLPYPLLSQDKARAVVDACEHRLLTPCGLRSLDPADSRYVGAYGGDQGRRDGSYHQGTVWGWLIGPFADAALYAYGDRERAMSTIRPLLRQTRTAGIGTISEIFDGDFPHAPRGCIAQAWSVAEVLRVLERLRHINAPETKRS